MLYIKGITEKFHKLFLTVSNIWVLAWYSIICAADVPDATGEVTVSEITGSTCRLSWAPPANLHGAAIIHYIVEKKERGRRSWQLIKHVSPNLYTEHSRSFFGSSVSKFNSSHSLDKSWWNLMCGGRFDWRKWIHLPGYSRKQVWPGRCNRI